MVLALGSVVILDGLSDSRFNGRKGVLLSFNAQINRWTVRVEIQKTISVRAANILEDPQQLYFQQLKQHGTSSLTEQNATSKFFMRCCAGQGKSNLAPLLAAGANPNVYNISGGEPDDGVVPQCSPLTAACEEGYLDTVKYLVEHCHVDINQRTYSGGFPLLNAIQYGHVRVVEYLVEAKADLHLRKPNGSDALSLAAEFNENNSSAKIIDLLVCSGMDVNRMDYNGHAPIHHAAKTRNLLAGRSLLHHGAHIDEPTGDAYNRTPLYLSMLGKRDDMTRRDANCFVKWLIENGADVDARDGTGQSVLAQAIGYGHYADFKLLVKKGVDLVTPCVIPAALMPPGRDPVPTSPVMLALMSQNADMLRIFRKNNIFPTEEAKQHCLTNERNEMEILRGSPSEAFKSGNGSNVSAFVQEIVDPVTGKKILARKEREACKCDWVAKEQCEKCSFSKKVFGNLAFGSKSDLVKELSKACCASCGISGVRLRRCARCESVSYCGGSCQSVHWKNGHREECRSKD